MCNHTLHDSVSSIKDGVISYSIVCYKCKETIKVLNTEQYSPNPDLTIYRSNEEYERAHAV